MKYLRSSSFFGGLSLSVLVFAGVLSSKVAASGNDTSSALGSRSTSTSCTSASSAAAFLGDGFCDSYLNSEECGYDGGDCCSCTCESGGYYDCGDNGYACIDPEASCVDDDDVTSLDVLCVADWFSDGFCDLANNKEICGYDGGDCCSCTCASGGYYDCGDSPYACIDPEALCVDDDDVTASIVANCATHFFSDGFCDPENNNELCGYDGGDCCSCTCASGGYYDCGDSPYACIDPEALCVDHDDVTASIVANCYPHYLSDGYCHLENNNEICGYDGGDCCSCTCASGGYYDCEDSPYACIDPEAPCVDDDDVTTSMVLADCATHFFSDGFCDPDNNNELCGYDGGDCCPCTCASGGYYGCGDGGYDCIDPEAVCVDNDDDTCESARLGDGVCDSINNTELCGYDGGDCCSCTCSAGRYVASCGEAGFDCIDPEARCEDDDQASEDSAGQSLMTSPTICAATFTAGFAAHLIILAS